MEKFVTVHCPYSQQHVDRISETLEAMNIPVIISYEEAPIGKRYRVMVPERFYGRAAVAVQDVPTVPFFSVKQHLSGRFSEDSPARTF